MNENVVSIETLFDHYGLYRWKLERESSARFVELWSQVAASACHDEGKLVLVNAIWALASFERAFDFLEANCARLEKVRTTGVLPAQVFLSGPYGQASVHYLLGASLWLDLADVFVWYRAIVHRIGHLKKPARAGRIHVTEAQITRLLTDFRHRSLAQFGNTNVVDLANTLLHQSWHPTIAHDISFKLYWKGAGGNTVDFAEHGDARAAVRSLVEETLDRTTIFVRSVIR